MRYKLLIGIIIIGISGAFTTLEKRESVEFNAPKFRYILNHNKEAVAGLPVSAAKSVPHTWTAGKAKTGEIILYSNYVKGVKTHCLYNNLCFSDTGTLNRLTFDACADRRKPVLKNKQDGLTYTVEEKGEQTILSIMGQGTKETYRVKNVERVYYTTEKSGYEITLISQ